MQRISCMHCLICVSLGDVWGTVFSTVLLLCRVRILEVWMDRPWNGRLPFWQTSPRPLPARHPKPFDAQYSLLSPYPSFVRSGSRLNSSGLEYQLHLGHSLALRTNPASSPYSDRL